MAADARRAILRRVLSSHGPLSGTWLQARYPWEARWLDTTLTTLVEGGEAVAGTITSPANAPEYCDRRSLERIHRRTLALLRKEVEPVSIYAYADFLARWQHLHPGERLSGPAALARLLQQMRGVPAPGTIWERDLLPLRLAAFEPAELEDLCGRGEVVWAGSGGKDPRRARVRFLFRGEGNLFLAPRPEEPELSPVANEVLEFLAAEGACFFADLEVGTGRAGHELNGALVELVMSGLVTNDSLQALRGVLASSAAADASGPQRRPLSSLEAELASWRATRRADPAIGQRPEKARLHRARRTVARRVERGTSPRWPGRWSLVHRIGLWGKEPPPEDRIERQARQLLHCFGVVTRHSLDSLLASEPLSGGAWDWGALYAQFQLMEMRGEVRRGYFVQGLPGVQFALPEAVERLREWTRPGPPGDDDPVGDSVGALVLVNACDPANLFGPALPGVEEGENDPARFTRIPPNYVVLLRGRPVLLLEAGGERLVTLPHLPSETLRRALRLAVQHVGTGQRRLTLRHWNGEPVLDSAVAPLLEREGFRREALVYVWESP